MKRPAATLALLGLAACARVPETMPAQSVPLAQLSDLAHRVVETETIDIGTASARAHLWRGWGPDETGPQGSFSWGGGAGSLMSFEMVEPRDRRLSLHGWSYPFGDAPPQEVGVWLNGHEIARRLLGPRPGMIGLDVSESSFRAGENFLELRYRRFDGRAGWPPWAAAWDRMRLDRGRGEERPAPSVDAATGEVLLPARTELEWAIELPGNSWLAWDRVELRGADELEVAVTSGEEEHVRRLGAGRGRMRLTREGEPHRLTGLALRALGSSGELSVVGARLFLSDLADSAAAETESAPVAPQAGERPNVVIYLIDTLRADRLGCYGYPRPTSPAIDRFAGDSVRWVEARAQSSWTRPAVTTILTGLYPVTHNVQDSRDRVHKRINLLSETFRTAGYQTAMVTANGNVGPQFGFRQGWDFFVHLHEDPERLEVHVQSEVVNRVAFDWLDRREPDKPYLLVVHTADPHDPYTPRQPFRGRLAPQVDDLQVGSRARLEALSKLPKRQQMAARDQLSALYDAEIAANDDSFGRFVRRLDRKHSGSETAILLLSDHGEELFEHEGWTHGRTLYEEQLRIPMILRLPHRAHAGTVMRGPAEQIDVAPTLLALAGMATPDGLPGRDLLDEVESRAAAPNFPASFSFLRRNHLAASSIVRAQWKLIRNEAWRPGPLGAPAFELFALGSDPDEQRDRARDERLQRLQLLGLLQAMELRFPPSSPAEFAPLDAELERTLRSLGYL